MPETSRGKKEGSALDALVEYIGSFFPDLRKKLRMAKMKKTQNEYIMDVLVISAMLTLILSVCVALFTIVANGSLLWLAVMVPLIAVATFLFMMKRVDVVMLSRQRNIDKDLLFAGRQLLIEVRGGIPLYDGIVHLTSDYGEVSRAFKEIVDKANLGVPLDVAMEDVAEETPSKPFKRLVLQIVNSIRSGSDIAVALETILDQMSQEQLIEIKAYGQKLNPLGMFYMLFGIIMPSLGVTLIVTIFTFTGVALGQAFLFGALLLVLLMQYMFLTMIESSRPRFEV
ncbi:MAG: type II secretion system F family protein [Candidatus Micrarchaeota archaeon]|nr:type II secretion system F family protein [Candidatus Micrarchaeota archaeon]